MQAMESGTHCSRPILTLHWVRFGGHFRQMCECSLTRSTFCIDAFTVFHLGVFFSRVTVCCATVQAKCLHLFVSLFLNSFDHGACVFASRAFVTVTLAANMRDGMWTQIVFEEKSDRVHPHGPTFPCPTLRRTGSRRRFSWT